MAALIRRPLLVGGVGLGAILWLWTNLETSVADWGEWITWLTIASGGLWWWRYKSQRTQLASPPQPVNKETVEQTLAVIEAAIADLATENQDISSWQNRLDQLREEMNRQTLKLAIAGGKNVGKTSLAHLLAKDWTIVETPALFTPNPTAEIATEINQKLTDSDVIVFVVAGDLTDSEYQRLNEWHESHHQVILILNKKDQYLPQDLPSILQQLRSRTIGKLENVEVMAIAAAPQPIKVRKYQSDGSLEEWMETPAPQIDPLKTSLAKISATSNVAILATVQRKAELLQSDIQEQWNQIRRDRALPIIEQYQWIAAATAFANPIPSLDLLTTGAITSQLILDIANLYQPTPSFTLQHAQKAAGTLGELMVKLGLVELSTQTITSVLKTNAITYAAGGLVQGISAAYLTRIAGLSLIEYFQTPEIHLDRGLNLDRLTSILKQVFDRNQRTAFIQSFVTTAVNKLRSPETDPQPSAIASTPN